MRSGRRGISPCRLIGCLPPVSPLLISSFYLFIYFTLSRKRKNNIMSSDLVFLSLPPPILPPHCCHSFHSSQHLPRAFHLWRTAGGFVTLSASVPVRKICLSRCKHVSKGGIQIFIFFLTPTGESIFYGCGFLRNSRSQLDTISAGK